MTNELSGFDLPPVIARYLSTPSNEIGQILESLFVNDAVVHDDGHTHTGIGAITAWKSGVTSSFTFTRTVTAATVWDSAAVVLVRIEGDFPGSPVDLHHHFSLSGEKIIAMTICT